MEREEGHYMWGNFTEDSAEQKKSPIDRKRETYVIMSDHRK